MNCYFTEEHQLFREFKGFLQRSCASYWKMGENGHNRTVYMEKFGEMGFSK
jgi:hypothetical protein